MSFRPLTRADLALLGAWLARPHVSRWWPERADPASLEATYGPSIDGTDPTEVRVIELDGRPVGLIQRYRTAEHPEWARALAGAALSAPAAGLDYLLGEEVDLGRGVGPAAVARFTAETWARYPEIEVVAVAVQQANRRSWRALEKCGFRRTWAGELDSDDPSDAGPSFLYQLARPGGSLSGSGRDLLDEQVAGVDPPGHRAHGEVREDQLVGAGVAVAADDVGDLVGGPDDDRLAARLAPSLGQPPLVGREEEQGLGGDPDLGGVPADLLAVASAAPRPCGSGAPGWPRCSIGRRAGRRSAWSASRPRRR